MNQQEIRGKAQDEIETITNNHTSVDRIIHHTQEDTENTIGLTWTNLSHIFF